MTRLECGIRSVLHRVLLGAGAAALLAACGGQSGLHLEASGLEPPPVPPPAEQSVAVAVSEEQSEDAQTTHASVPWVSGEWELPPEGASPLGVWIPQIDVSAPMRGLGLNADATLEVPSESDVVGWYTGGPRPGVHGPAVLAGHVDSMSGPAVFHRLDDLRRGDLVHVVYEGGFVATFVVLGAERVRKDAFPTARVYGDRERPELRLITCGGRFDRSSGAYEENVIVYATIYATWEHDPPG